jgi:hypothetical protein
MKIKALSRFTIAPYCQAARNWGQAYTVVQKTPRPAAFFAPAHLPTQVAIQASYMPQLREGVHNVEDVSAESGCEGFTV